MLVAVASLKGSPGATTLAVGLADRWPAGADPVVVEADPAGGDLAARFGLAPARGLVSLAAAARRGGGPGLLFEHAQELDGGLLVVAAPPGAEQARAVSGELRGGGWSPVRAAAADPEAAVVADCGRLDAESPALPLVLAADVLLVVVRARDDELSHLAAKLGVLAGWRLPAWFVVVAAQPGRHDGYAVRDVSRALGARVLGPVPYDPAGAAVLAGRARSRAGAGRSWLGRAAAVIAGQLAAYGDTGGRETRETVPAALPGRPAAPSRPAAGLPTPSRPAAGLPTPSRPAAGLPAGAAYPRTPTAHPRTPTEAR